MKKIYFLLVAFIVTSFSFGQDALITGYVDSPCPSQLGRTVEIYVDGTIDFTGWNLVRQSNGGGFTTNIDLTSLGSISDAFAYITNDSATLNSEFGINTNVITSGAITDNGDDAFQIIDDMAAVVDRFGEDGVDGTGQPWEHLDTYYYRVDGTVANGGTFNVLGFTFGALNLLDGEGLCNTANALSTLVPFGTYSTTASTTPTINVSGSVSGLDYFEGNGPSGEGTFTVSGINLTANISVAAPTNFEISTTSGSGFTNSLNLTQTGGNVATTTIYTRLAAGLTANTYNGDVTASSTGATNQTVSLTGTVDPAVPQITVGGSVNAFNYTFGAGPSAEDDFTVSGLFLTTDIVVTAPANYEVSLTSGSGFTSSVNVAHTGGTVSTTTVYVRLAAGLAINTYTGDITISSTGVTNETISLTGNVYGAPTNALVLTGVYDAPLTGGTPKGIELMALADIPDLSKFGISSITNGAGSSAGNIEYTFPADALNAGDRIFLATESTNFNSFFGQMPTYTNGVVGINGDDAVELYENGQIIDTFGDVNMDGTGQPWEYLDGWAYRNNNTGPDGGFVIGNWTFSGANVFDGQTTNATSPTPYPFATYTNVLSIANNVLPGFKMYPNPSGVGFINIITNSNEIKNVTIYDLLGKKVIKETTNNQVNISSLHTGVYVVKVEQNNKVATKRLIVK